VAGSTLTIALQDGFENDSVVVRVDGEVVIQETGVRTDQRIGLAYAIDVPLPDRAVVIDVQVPTRSLRARHELSPATATSVGISLLDNQIVFRSSPTPFGYA
jgi:hypothetical protein